LGIRAWFLPVFFALGILPGGAHAAQLSWQGQVDGIAILRIQGKTLTVDVREGAPVERAEFHFSDPLPDSRQDVRVETLEGRGYVHVIEQPKAENRYTLSVEIEDRQAGSGFYSIALYWDPSDNAFQRGSPKVDKAEWSGRVDGATIVVCGAKTCKSSGENGGSVASSERSKFSKPLPERDTEVRLEGVEGRGEVRLIDQPRQRNHYTVRVSIRDLGPGAGDYAFNLVWNRASSKDVATEKAAPIPEPAGRGLLWSGKVDGRVRITVQGGASFSEVMEGERIAGQQSEILRPLPARSGPVPELRKLTGRGDVRIVEMPSEQNNFRLVFEIADPEPGADDYVIEVDW
jgi:hypothetical protein